VCVCVWRDVERGDVCVCVLCVCMDGYDECEVKIYTPVCVLCVWVKRCVMGCMCLGVRYVCACTYVCVRVCVLAM